jgi:hypothetical protein
MLEVQRSVHFVYMSGPSCEKIYIISEKRSIGTTFEIGITSGSAVVKALRYKRSRVRDPMR